MNRSSNHAKLGGKEIRAIWLSVLFLFLGCIVAWIIKSVLKIEGDAVFVSLLLIPLLVYAIISGKLEELKGPGGLEAKFAKAASESVSIASEEIKPSVEEMQMVSKESVKFLERKQREIDETKPIVMLMKLGKTSEDDYSQSERDYYGRQAVLQYLEALSKFRNFKFIVFVDINQRFLAYMPSWALKGLLSEPELGGRFIRAVNQGRKSELFRYPGLVREAIRTQSTNAEALREMMRQNLEALIVTDENDRLAGVVEREQVLSRMMLSLVR
jgi:hypothetical protein